MKNHLEQPHNSCSTSDTSLTEAVELLAKRAVFARRINGALVKQAQGLDVGKWLGGQNLKDIGLGGLIGAGIGGVGGGLMSLARPEEERNTMRDIFTGALGGGAVGAGGTALYKLPGMLGKSPQEKADVVQQVQQRKQEVAEGAASWPQQITQNIPAGSSAVVSGGLGAGLIGRHIYADPALKAQAGAVQALAAKHPLAQAELLAGETAAQGLARMKAIRGLGATGGAGAARTAVAAGALTKDQLKALRDLAFSTSRFGAKARFGRLAGGGLLVALPMALEYWARTNQGGKIQAFSDALEQQRQVFAKP